MTSRVRLRLGAALGLAAGALACPLPATIGEDDPGGTSEGTAVATASTGPVAPDDEGGSNEAAGTSPGETADPGTSGPAVASTDGDGGTTEGDTSTGEDTSEPACVRARRSACDDDEDVLHALGLGCPGGASAGSLEIGDVSGEALAVATQYGSAWAPVEGERLLVLTTGRLEPGAAPGGVQEVAGAGANGNPDGVPLPAPISVMPGSNGGAGGSPFQGCDGTNDCSDSLAPWMGDTASDLVTTSFDVEVPPRVAGVRLDFAFMSAEYPEFVFTPYADLFIVWVEGEAFTGNACALGLVPCSPDTIVPTPVDPGLGTVGGGATGWRTIRVPATPGETLELTLALLDGGDTDHDSAVVLDRWRWDCDDCRDDPSVPCGVVDQLPD